MHLLVTPTTNIAVEQGRIEQTALQPQLMTNTVEKQAHSKQIPLAEQLNTTATAEKSEVLSNNAKKALYLSNHIALHFT